MNSLSGEEESLCVDVAASSWSRCHPLIAVGVEGAAAPTRNAMHRYTRGEVMNQIVIRYDDLNKGWDVGVEFIEGYFLAYRCGLRTMDQAETVKRDFEQRIRRNAEE
jgi:hypothetical protein